MVEICESTPLIHHKIVNTMNLEKTQQHNLGSRGGIYLFGGKNESGKMQNKLRVLRSCSSELDKMYDSKF